MQIGEFEYSVTIEILLTVDEAKVLKDAAANHYDYKCRESGQSGIINGLWNTATWAVEHEASGAAAEERADDPAWRARGMKCSWHDFDRMRKTLEAARGFLTRMSSGPLVPAGPNYDAIALDLDKRFRRLMQMISEEEKRCSVEGGKPTDFDPSLA